MSDKKLSQLLNFTLQVESEEGDLDTSDEDFDIEDWEADIRGGEGIIEAEGNGTDGRGVNSNISKTQLGGSEDSIDLEGPNEGEHSACNRRNTVGRSEGWGCLSLINNSTTIGSMASWAICV